MDVKAQVRALSRSAHQLAPSPLHPSSIPRQRRASRVLRNPDGPLALNLGCGDKRLEGFVNIDRRFTSATDYIADVGDLPCDDETVERIETHHMMEHIPYDDARAMVVEWRRVLRPGGTLAIECADGFETVIRYLEGQKSFLSTVYGRRRYPGDGHVYRYNAERLTALLHSAGLEQVHEEPTQACTFFDEPCLRVTATK